MSRLPLSFRLAAAAAVAGVLAAAPSAGAAPLPVGPAIQPGVRIAVVDLEGPVKAIGACTGGFLFDGTDERAGTVYMGTAAHCVRELGQDVSLLATGEVFGDVAWMGDANTYDIALIEVRQEFASRLKAGVLGHEEFPKRVAPPGLTKAGDAVLVNDLVVVPKPQGVLVSDDARGYVIDARVIPFDSGGPVVHVPSGGALGVVSRGHDCTAGPFDCASYSGPTVHRAVEAYEAAGFPVRLRTA
jgi:hypothetical protein